MPLSISPSISRGSQGDEAPPHIHRARRRFPGHPAAPDDTPFPAAPASEARSTATTPAGKSPESRRSSRLSVSVSQARHRDTQLRTPRRHLLGLASPDETTIQKPLSRLILGVDPGTSATLSYPKTASLHTRFQFVLSLAQCVHSFPWNTRMLCMRPVSGNPGPESVGQYSPR